MCNDAVQLLEGHSHMGVEWIITNAPQQVIVKSVSRQLCKSWAKAKLTLRSCHPTDPDTLHASKFLEKVTADIASSLIGLCVRGTCMYLSSRILRPRCLGVSQASWSLYIYWRRGVSDFWDNSHMKLYRHSGTEIYIGEEVSDHR